MKTPKVKLFSIVATAIMLSGCGLIGEPKIDTVSFDANGMAEKAFAEYDLNQDGSIADEELKSAPSLNSALAEIDTDGDQKISIDEMVACITNWNEVGPGLQSVECEIAVDGVPLTGATVTLEPESFLGPEITAGTAITDESGVAYMVSEEAKAKGFPEGMRLGFYKVKVSKLNGGEESVPAKYNESTTLGRAISPNDRLSSYQFMLKRK